MEETNQKPELLEKPVVQEELEAGDQAEQLVAPERIDSLPEHAGLKSRQRTFNIITLSLIAILAIIFGLIFLMAFQSTSLIRLLQQQNLAEALPFIVKQTPKPTATPVPTSDPIKIEWRKYSNPDLGFQIQYPSKLSNGTEVIVTENNNTITFSSSPQWNFKITTYESSSSATIIDNLLTDDFAQRNNWKIEDKGEIEVNGRKARQVDWLLDMGTLSYVLIEDNQTVYQIESFSHYESYDEILQSFEIIRNIFTTNEETVYQGKETPDFFFKPYQLSVPTGWRINETLPGKEQFVFLEKEDHKLKIQHVATEGYVCTFDDLPEDIPLLNENNQITDYVQIGERHRRFINPNQRLEDKTTFTVCEASSSNVYVGHNLAGFISYEVPKDFDTAIISEMDQMVQSLKYD